MTRIFLCVALLLSLAGCATDVEFASDDEVSRAIYVHDGPPAITLFTVISNRSDGGAHSGLLINGSQQVMFDPAGSWQHPYLPERHDVHFGVTPKMVNFYIDYHARETFRVVEQTVIVTPEQAEMVLRRALAYGPVPKSQCTRALSTVLRDVPGFESLSATWYPTSLMKEFGQLPGVVERTITDDDADKNYGVLLVQAAEKPL